MRRVGFALVCLPVVLLVSCVDRSDDHGRSEPVPETCREPSRLMALDAQVDQFVYPQYMERYQAGTLVYQPRTGRFYRCKDDPYTKFCRTLGAYHRFEPGLGSNWVAAWDIVPVNERN